MWHLKAGWNNAFQVLYRTCRKASMSLNIATNWDVKDDRSWNEFCYWIMKRAGKIRPASFQQTFLSRHFALRTNGIQKVRDFSESWSAASETSSVFSVFPLCAVSLFDAFIFRSGPLHLLVVSSVSSEPLRCLRCVSGIWNPAVMFPATDQSRQSNLFRSQEAVPGTHSQNDGRRDIERWNSSSKYLPRTGKLRFCNVWSRFQIWEYIDGTFEQG